MKLWLARFANHGRLWSDFLFDYEGLRKFTAFLERLLDRNDFADCLESVYIVAIRRLSRSVPFPLEASQASDQPMSFGIGLYSMIPGRDPGTAKRVAKTMSECLQECVALGGRPYRYGWHELTESRSSCPSEPWPRCVILRGALLEKGRSDAAAQLPDLEGGS